MAGGVFQMVWFLLSAYFVFLVSVDVGRPWVLFEGGLPGVGIRLFFFSLGLYLLAMSAPAACWPGVQEAISRRCCCTGPRCRAALFVGLLPAMHGRGEQYHFAWDEANHSWGWLIVLVILAAVLNVLTFLLLTLAWLLTGGPCKQKKA
mmetsp:Transcript_18019/g.55746  ORF Transcript_18019/g.55746 Transcript_18019/m.55746 type:complete len:148 (+) Transcript_18019:109-552(+)